MEEFRFQHDGRRYRVGASIGLVPVDHRWSTTSAILQAADTSCYAAKEAGRNRVHAWFDTDQAMRARQGQMQWVSRIEQALDENHFELYAQRIVPVSQNAQGLHCEVLLRLREADGAIIGPGAFLPAVERFHMASRVDRWVIRHVFDHLTDCGAAAQGVELIALNLSGQSIGDRAFLREITQWIHDAHFDVRKICFEITETAAITNLVDAKAFIEEVRGMGVKVALDDFGAGASSFGYLKNLPVDFLKIDGHFITGLLDDALDNAAVRCFHEISRVVGVQTIAEFVERKEVLDALGVIGIDYAQGYLMHRPEPLSVVVPRLEAQAV
jgi:EAL domain-containing protein (putative c-di-GMP-specific phosphodiesterase class I)